MRDDSTSSHPDGESDSENQAADGRAPEKSAPDDSASGEQTTEQRFQRIKAQLEAMKLPDLHEAELNSKLDPVAQSTAKLPEVPDLEAVHKELWQSKSSYEYAKQESSKSLRRDQEVSHSLGIGLTIAYTIIGVPLAGILVGSLLDWKLQTNIFKPLGALGGATLGVFAVMIQIKRNTPTG